jgi:hypothetical protein
MKLVNTNYSKHVSLIHKSLVCGVGINDADYYTSRKKNKKNIWRCPFYARWSLMLNRCYSSKFHKNHPTYIGCSVCPEWHKFSNFRLWMIEQKWEGMELDKDLLVRGNKVYSPDTCCFLPKTVNNIFGGSKKQKNVNLPEGVNMSIHGKYIVRISNPRLFNRHCYLTFSILKEAHLAAIQKKIESIQYCILDYELDIRVVFALNREINEMQEQINNIQNSSPNLFDIA